MEAKGTEVRGVFRIGRGGVLWRWPVDNLIVHCELEGGETQGGMNMEERLLSIWVGQRRA